MIGAGHFETARIWPIELRFPHAAGTTLWGDGNSPDGSDRCLVIDDVVVLFETLGALAAFVAGPISSNLSNTPGYETFRQQAAVGWPTDVDRIDFTALLLTLREPPASWPRAAAAEMVDSLNLLSDLYNSVERGPSPPSVSPSDYAEFADRLTFLGPDEGLATVVSDLTTTASWPPSKPSSERLSHNARCSGEQEAIARGPGPPLDGVPWSTAALARRSGS